MGLNFLCDDHFCTVHREAYTSRHNEGTIKGSSYAPRTSRLYGTGGVKGGPQSSFNFNFLSALQFYAHHFFSSLCIFCVKMALLKGEACLHIYSWDRAQILRWYFIIQILRNLCRFIIYKDKFLMI